MAATSKPYRHWQVVNVARALGIRTSEKHSFIGDALGVKLQWGENLGRKALVKYFSSGYDGPELVGGRKPRQPRAPREPRAPRVKSETTTPNWAGHVDPNSVAFLSSYEWRRIRLTILKRDGPRCACCGASRETGAVIHVDHIKPRRIFPELALDPNNLQVLCEPCNHGKGNWDMTDFRKPLTTTKE